MTRHLWSREEHAAGYPARDGRGLAGASAGMAGGAVGSGGSAGPGTAGAPGGIGAAAGSGGTGLTGGAGVTGGAGLTGGGPTGPVVGVPPGLVWRVQRRLAADGRVAVDPGGLRTAVTEALGEDGILLPEASLAPVVRAIGAELTGLGPLAPLLADPAVTDVLVNGPTDVWVERAGSIERAAVRFTSAAAVAAMVQRVVAPLGLRVDEARPWVDARLPGGRAVPCGTASARPRRSGGHHPDLREATAPHP
jgi:type II/IV secretion system protein